MRKIRRQVVVYLFSFFLFSLRTATGQPVGPNDDANGSNKAS